MYGGKQWVKGERDLTGLPLDPIGVACCANMVKIAQITYRWFPEMTGVLEGRHRIWSLREGRTVSPSYIAASRAAQITQLLAWGVIEQSIGGRGFVSFFTVPKSDGLSARAICNCRSINEWFRETLMFRLAHIEEIIKVLGWFKRSLFLVMDFRHWFHQLVLPETWRSLFCFNSQGVEYRWRSWPMGFKYTPIVAQCVAVSVVREAFEKVGLLVRDRTEEGPDPVVVAKCRSSGSVEALAVVWYDNILVVGGNSSRMGAIRRALQKILGETGIRLKGDIVQSSETVSFLGMEARTVGHKVSVRHVEQNAERWSRLQREGDTREARQWLQLLGVANWHIRVKGSSFSSIRDLYKAVFRNVKDCYEDGNWSRRISLPTGSARELDQVVGEAISREEYERCEAERPSRSVVCVASDASDWGAAGLEVLSGAPSLLLQRRWTAMEKERHINVRELIAAVETLERCDVEGRVVVIGIDNTTAIAHLQAHWKIADAALLDRVLTIEAKAAELRVIYLPSEQNVADGPSRGSPFLESQLVSTRTKLEEAGRNRWYDEEMSGCKKDRR